jgi:hypothetical protein
MTDDEKKIVQQAINLLISGTSNSLNPESREEWKDRRDRVAIELREMAR